MPQIAEYKLSICIPTFNRASFLAQALDSIVNQVDEDCEIVVSDNASTDNTEEVVSKYAQQHKRIRYHKQQTNTGFDRNVDFAVQLARGEYCWLMPDDDQLKAGAVQAVRRAMHEDVSLITVNVEFRDRALSSVVQCSALSYECDKVYEPCDLDALYLEVGTLHGYVGSIVMRRSVWLGRNTERYLGSGWIYLAMIYQERLPGKTVVIAQPLIEVRLGNLQAWWSSIFEMYMKASSFRDSLALSDAVKRRSRSVEPWKDAQTLLWLRAIGAYSSQEYREWIRPKLRSRRELAIPYLIAKSPYILINALFVIYYKVTRRDRHGYSAKWVLQHLESGRYHQSQRWRMIASSSVQDDQLAP